jgi:Caudovirus prohead serine protease
MCPASADDAPAKRRFAPAGSDADLRQAYRDEQIISRRAEGDRLIRQARAFLPKAKHVKARERAERDARQALAAYRASLDWAEDTAHEDEAHRLLDEAGSWVRRTFGCHLERHGQQYQQTCPVALGHNRIGLSVGGRASKQICSLCAADVSECEHLPGTAYLVPGGSDDLGWCRVCCQPECEHLQTETYRASLVSIIREMELHEVSVVTKPAHPEARIQLVSIPLSDLRAELGNDFQPGMDVSCDRCLSPCEGLIRHRDLAHG